MAEQIPDHRHVHTLLRQLRSERVAQHMNARPLQSASLQ